MNKIIKNEIYEEFSNFVSRIAISFYNSWNNASNSYLGPDDFIQEALMNFWDKIETVDEKRDKYQKAAYLKKITENFLINFIRRQHTKKRYHIKEPIIEDITDKSIEKNQKTTLIDDYDIEKSYNLTDDEKEACKLLKEGNKLSDVIEMLGWSPEDKQKHIENIQKTILEDRYV